MVFDECAYQRKFGIPLFNNCLTTKFFNSISPIHPFSHTVAFLSTSDFYSSKVDLNLALGQ